MKLYNIFENIILEEELLNEAKSFLVESDISAIKQAMQGSYDVWLKYVNSDGIMTDKYVEIDKLGRTKKGKLAIRIYQKGGKAGSSEVNKWKILLVDKIVPGSIRPTNMINYRSVGELPSYKGPKYNKTGDRLMTGTITRTNYKY
jgi:hypothetical protein